MNKRERVYAALGGQAVDIVPLSLWRHFHKQDQTADGLASATLSFYHKYQFDLIKLTPSGLYAVEDWGAQIVLSNNDDTPPYLKRPLIREPEDWRDLTTLNLMGGSYELVLEATTLVKNRLGERDAPVFMTIFSPMTIAYKLAGDTLLEHLKSNPTDVHIGLATIAETTARFAQETIEAGADGIFFASQLSRSDMLDKDMCETFVVRYDMIALGRVDVPVILHLHGKNPYFETVNQYPVQAISWHNHETKPSLTEAVALTNKTLITGLDRNLFEQGSPEKIATQVRETIKQTGGQRLIIAPSCVIPTSTPLDNLQAVVDVDRSVM